MRVESHDEETSLSVQFSSVANGDGGHCRTGQHNCWNSQICAVCRLFYKLYLNKSQRCCKRQLWANMKLLGQDLLHIWWASWVQWFFSRSETVYHDTFNTDLWIKTVGPVLGDLERKTLRLWAVTGTVLHKRLRLKVNGYYAQWSNCYICK